MEEGVPIEHGMVTRAIERAQKQVEAQNFSVRKHLLEYDDVMNKQRENIYTLRRSLLEDSIRLDEDEATADAHGYLIALAGDVLDDIVERFVGAETDLEEWDVPGLKQEIIRVYGLEEADLSHIAFDTLNTDEIRQALWTRLEKAQADKEALLGPELMRRIERDIMLQIVDQQWKDHLYSLDHLKEGIGLRGYGQRDPLVEYKRESFALFQDMKARVEDDIVRHLWHLRPVSSEDGGIQAPPPVRRSPPRPRAAHPERPGRRAVGLRRPGDGRGRTGESVCAEACPRRRRRRGGEDSATRGAESRPERPVSVRQRQEIQEMSRSRRVSATARGILPCPYLLSVKADSCRPLSY